MLADRLLWIAEEPSEDLSGRAHIVEHVFGRSGPTIRYRAEQAAANINGLLASREWLVWLEHRDRRTLRDAKLFATRVDGGERILVEDFGRYQLATFPDLALDGADLYWTVPLLDSGVWRGRLMRRHLPAGAAEIIVQGPSGVFLSWPAALGGTLAYEVARQDGNPAYAVQLRMPSGATRDLPAPSSEPSLGDGFMAFKASDRYAEGTLKALMFDTDRLIELGHGDQPRTFGALVVWHSRAPASLGNYIAAPRSNCVVKLPEELPSTEGTPSLPALGPGRVAWRFVSFIDPNDRVRTAPLLSAPC